MLGPACWPATTPTVNLFDTELDAPVPGLSDRPPDTPDRVHRRTGAWRRAGAARLLRELRSALARSRPLDRRADRRDGHAALRRPHPLRGRRLAPAGARRPLERRSLGAPVRIPPAARREVPRRRSARPRVRAAQLPPGPGSEIDRRARL